MALADRSFVGQEPAVPRNVTCIGEGLRSRHMRAADDEPSGANPLPSVRLRPPMVLGRPLTRDDRALVAAAQHALRRGFVERRHGVAAAVRTRSGNVYLGLNLAGIHTPCAEPVAVGAARTAGDPAIEAMVAVTKRGRSYPVISPCGTCRQLLIDYAPKASTIVRFPNGSLRRLTAEESLPGAFRTFRTR